MTPTTQSPTIQFPLFASTTKLIAVAAFSLLVGACSQTPTVERESSTLSSEQIQQSCVLMPEAVSGEKLIGSFDVSNTSPGSIKFPGVTEDKVFDLDTLYRVDNGTESSSFRVSEKNFIKGSMYLSGLAWQGNKSISPVGTYKFYAVSVANNKPGTTMTMVGDSITWWSYGRYFRCMLSQRMPGINFTGPHTDSFGFGHAGEGGNNTYDIIKRLDKIPAASNYFILAGTNDWPKGAPEQTFENIKLIAGHFSSSGSRVIVSTLLPRLDEHDAINIDVNKLILDWNGKGCNCKVIDLASKFRALPDKRQYFWDAGLHPNIAGYDQIVRLITPDIERLVKK